MGPQVPSRPLPFFAAVHASQVPPQAVLQQTPSTQLLLAHSLAAVQVVPLVFLVRQMVPLQ